MIEKNMAAHQEDRSTQQQSSADGSERDSSMSKWTPGPWRTRSNTLDGSVEIRAAAGEYVCELSDRIYRDDDARLIAKAPEMAEALKSVIAEADRDTQAFNRAKRILREAGVEL